MADVELATRRLSGSSVENVLFDNPVFAYDEKSVRNISTLLARPCAARMAKANLGTEKSTSSAS